MMSDERIITEDSFTGDVLDADTPVLVDFWAEWCGPCKMLAPTIAQLARDNKGRAVVGKVNVEHCPALAERYGISGIPTLILFKDGEIAEKVVGVQSRQALQELIDRHCA
jgi:thioredoxin 1